EFAARLALLQDRSETIDEIAPLHMPALAHRARHRRSLAHDERHFETTFLARARGGCNSGRQLVGGAVPLRDRRVGHPRQAFEEVLADEVKSLVLEPHKLVARGRMDTPRLPDRLHRGAGAALISDYPRSGLEIGATLVFGVERRARPLR